MDSSNGSYMPYNNSNNDDLSQFFNDVQDYANLSNEQTQFDPALFAESGLAPFSQQTQPSQPTQSNFNHTQRQSQSQSPALPQFKPSHNSYPQQQYAQNPYAQQALGQTFDPQLLSRPTPSPGPFDQYTYQSQHVNYGQPSFDYRFNSFQQQQRQAAAQTQAFRPQVNQQAAHYMSASQQPPQSQGHVSQVQNGNEMSYPFQQSHQVAPKFVEPSMLNSDGQAYRSQPSSITNFVNPLTRSDSSQLPQARPTESSPYFKMAGATLDPRALQMQQYAQLQQAHGQAAKLPQQGAVQSQFPQSAMHFAAQNAAITANPVSNLQAKRDGRAQGSITSSDDDLDIEDDEEPETKPALITIAKPADDRGKLLWEVVEAVWTPRNKPAAPEKIRPAVKFVGDSVRGLRDKWKQTNEQLKQAELPNSPTGHQVEKLKVTVASYREVMETLAARVARFGHPSILKRLGSYELLLTAMYSFLLDRVNAEDYNSTLVLTILQLGTKLETVDEEQLERVKWTKILLRFTKKSTNESKTLAQQILNNAKKTTVKKKTDSAGQGPASPAGSSSGQIAGVKRAREGSEPTQLAKKATVKPSSKPLSVQLAEQRKLKEKQKVTLKDARTAKPAMGGANTAPVPARPKTANVLPQKASPFASLMSASKRPGTTLAERAAKEKVEPVRLVPAAPIPVKKELPSRMEAQPPRPTVSAAPSSSFLGFLADMEKPKEAPKAKVEEILDETADARLKRLRKESRRKLRVSWKPENELVETRVFEHDIDEDTGHEDSMMRDVGDTAKEGEMLKHRLQPEEMDEDEDSDDEMIYFVPSEVDFSDMGQDDFIDTNFVKGGGSLKPVSPCSDAQAEYEQGNLMATYAAGERPATPKEPLEIDDDDFNPVIDFGEPVQDRIRQREQQVMAQRQQYQQPQSNGFNLANAFSGIQSQQPVQPQPDWLHALGMANQPHRQQPPQTQPNLAGLDISKILAVAAQIQQQNPQQASVAAAAPPATTNVAPNMAALLGQYAGGLQQPNQPGSMPLPTGFGDNPNPFPNVAGYGKLDKRDKKDKKKAKGPGGVPLGENGLPINYKTKVCQFWLDNSCTKGDSCTYRHDRELLE